MIETMFPLLAALAFVACMMLGIAAGRHLGERGAAGESARERPGISTIEGALFALFGLLIAFTFSGAWSRYDTRRMLIVEEANAIGTAYLRIDLLAQESQPIVRELFRRYVEARLAVYRELSDFNLSLKRQEEAEALQREIWAAVQNGIRMKEALPSAPLLLVPALNAMIDVTTTRKMAALAHPPIIVFLLLLGTGMICGLLVGYQMPAAKKGQWFHIVTFVLISALTVYTILEIEYPRMGLIRVDRFDEALVAVLQTMK